MGRILHLNLKKKYFNDIKNGVKKEEYRLYNDYWKKRLINKWYDFIIVKLGYPRKDDEDKVMVFPYRGFVLKRIQHKEFGDKIVSVFSLKLEM